MRWQGGSTPEGEVVWSSASDASAVDFGSPVAGSPLPGSPMSGMVPPFANATPLAASTLPFADIAAHACNQAPALEAQVQTISMRVQKLERSRGQISKDIADMLSETRELQKKVGLDTHRQPAVGSSALGEEAASDIPVLSRVMTCPATRATEAAAATEDSTDEPPGLGMGRRNSRLKSAPASLPRVPEEQPLLAKSQTEKIPPPPGLSLPLPESLVVQPQEVDGKEISRVEWRIDNMKAKFKDCVGRPLVSPQFEASGLPELRLMVFPNLGIDTSGLTMREQKSRYEARISEGPLSGELKFKVVTNLGDKLVIRFNLFVGSIVQGPIEHNFADRIIHGLEFKENWLEQTKNGSLTVGVEMLTVHGQEAHQMRL
mmetsp:Transcript_89360/g.208019  ORF Transcript_89360/g.208019 Transcript_89360/m.208019 type:complete len:374 (-) Transcript_89360:35-1156(-)